MDALFKYAIVPALACAVGFVAIGFPGTASLRDVLAAWSEPEIVRIDSAAAAHIDEDLDYRIAQRSGSLKGWRSFLAAHENGVYAHSASAEVERLRLVSEAPVKPDAPPADTSPETKVVMVTSDEARERDGNRSERPLGNSMSTEATRSANDLASGASRPRLTGLGESVDSAPPAPAPNVAPEALAAPLPAKVEIASPVAPVPETKVASLDSEGGPPIAAPPIPPARISSAPGRSARSTASAGRASSTGSSRHQPRRHASGCAFKFICFRKAPPILLAILGEKPRRPTSFRQHLASASPYSLRYR